MSCRLAGSAPDGRHRKGECGHAGQVDRQRAARHQQLLAAVERRREHRQRGRGDDVDTLEDLVEDRAPLLLHDPGRGQTPGVDRRTEPRGARRRRHRSRRGVGPAARGRSPTPRPRAAVPAAAVASCQRGNSTSRTSHSEAARARSMAASINGSASTRSRPTRTGARSATAKPGFEELHAEHEARHVAGHGAHGVEARRQGPHALERDPTPRRLEPGRAAARGGDPDRPARVTAVGDVGLERWPPPPPSRSTSPRARVEDRGGSPASRTTGSRPSPPAPTRGGWSGPRSGRPPPWRPARHAASLVRRDRLVGHRPAPGRGGHALHVDQVLHRQPDAGPEVSKRVMNVDMARPFCSAAPPLWHAGSGQSAPWPRRGYKRWASHPGGRWSEHLSPACAPTPRRRRRETWPC